MIDKQEEFEPLVMWWQHPRLDKLKDVKDGRVYVLDKDLQIRPGDYYRVCLTVGALYVRLSLDDISIVCWSDVENFTDEGYKILEKRRKEIVKRREGEKI